MSDSGSRGEIPAAPGGVSDMEDLEQRLADRMDTALTQRMDVMSAAIDQRVDALVDKLSSVLQGASGGNRSESGGGGSAAAAGGNQFAPGVQSGTPGGAEMSSIPGRPPTAVGPEGPQEGLLEVGGLDSSGGELASSVGGGGDFSGAAVYSLAKQQLPRIQPPSFKGNRKELVVVVAGEAAGVVAVELKDGASAATGMGTTSSTALPNQRTSGRSAETALGLRVDFILIAIWIL